LLSHEAIKVGEVSGVFGIKGWIKVFSFTQPRENILTYSPWQLQKGNEIKVVKLVNGRRQGKLIVAAIEGITDRNAAAEMAGCKILINKSQLPAVEGEYYWADLIGLVVLTVQGVELGVVDHLLETGANDVLVVNDGKRERLIPFLQQQTVLQIDVDNGRIIVDWDADF